MIRRLQIRLIVFLVLGGHTCFFDVQESKNPLNGLNYPLDAIGWPFFLPDVVTDVFCWQYFTRLEELTLHGSEPDPEVIHSEYHFGYCKPLKPKTIFYAHVHLNHMEVVGKIIIRGWLKIPRIPTCIVLRATSYEEDLFRSTAYGFQMCVPRITYCHSQRRFKYFYYEWYLPDDMTGGMNWDIYFYGPDKVTYD